MTDVGHFSRGFGAILFLNKIITQAIKPVILPHLAEVKRSGRSVTEAYLRSTNLLLAFTLPVFATAGAASYPMIIALFGDQWHAAIPVTSILAIWVMLVSVHGFSASGFIISNAENLMQALCFCRDHGIGDFRINSQKVLQGIQLLFQFQ